MKLNSITVMFNDVHNRDFSGFKHSQVLVKLHSVFYLTVYKLVTIAVVLQYTHNDIRTMQGYNSNMRPKHNGRFQQ